MVDFVPFPKIARFNRECVVTEKIDGTNASIYIGEGGEFLTGSRTRWITPEQDNHGFAAWAHAHREELMTLGPGTHFGEWWGSGIQRGYGLQKGEKRFSLFNVGRWGDEREAACRKCHLPASSWAPALCARCGDERPAEPPRRPACCHVVPTLSRIAGPLALGNDPMEKYQYPALWGILSLLRACGSVAAPGFMKPEGIVIYHTHGGHLYKVTLEKDDQPKGAPSA